MLRRRVVVEVAQIRVLSIILHESTAGRLPYMRHCLRIQHDWPTAWMESFRQGDGTVGFGGFGGKGLPCSVGLGSCEAWRFSEKKRQSQDA